jgi:hypothetical protein
LPDGHEGRVGQSELATLIEPAVDGAEHGRSTERQQAALESAPQEHRAVEADGLANE